MKKLLPLLFIPLSLTAQKDYSRLLDDYMQAQVNVKQFSGTVLVMSHNKPLLEKGMASQTMNGIFPIFRSQNSA